MHRILQIAVTLCILCLFLFVTDRIFQPTTTAAMTGQANEYALAKIGELPLHAFVYDGCTLWPEQILFHDLTEACLLHDIAYWVGGDAADRLVADVALREKVSHTGSLGPILGTIMYTSTRVFGNSLLTRYLKANWGFGFNES